jgi:hypothetical protein
MERWSVQQCIFCVEQFVLSIPRATSLSVWWHSVALQFTGPYCSRLFLWGYLKAQVFTHTLTDINSLKMQFVRRLRMLRRTLYVASWQVYLGDGSNALIVMEDISKTLYWRREAFLVNPRHWLTEPCSAVFIAVYNKYVILLSKWVTLNAAPCSLSVEITFLIFATVTSKHFSTLNVELKTSIFPWITKILLETNILTNSRHWKNEC